MRKWVDGPANCRAAPDGKNLLILPTGATVLLRERRNDSRQVVEPAPSEGFESRTPLIRGQMLEPATAATDSAFGSSDTARRLAHPTWLRGASLEQHGGAKSERHSHQGAAPSGGRREAGRRARPDRGSRGSAPLTPGVAVVRRVCRGRPVGAHEPPPTDPSPLLHRVEVSGDLGQGQRRIGAVRPPLALGRRSRPAIPKRRGRPPRPSCSSRSPIQPRPSPPPRPGPGRRRGGSGVATPEGHSTPGC